MSFRILRYVLQKRKALVWAFVLPAAAALLLVLFSGGKYRAESLLMPPMEEGTEGLLSAWMAQLNLPSMVVPTSAGSMTAAVLVDILESRRIAEIVIGELDLMEWYRTDSVYEAVKELRANTSVGGSATGMITLSVTDREPKRAFEILEAYITGLDTLNRELLHTRASATMEFIGEQLAEYRARLDASRTALAAFEEENGIVDFDEQIRGAVDVAATIKVRSVLADIELEMVRQFTTGDAVELKKTEAEAEMLAEQLRRIARPDTSSPVFPALSELPGLHQRHASMRRDLEVNERVYSFLLQRYEESRIELARSTPSIQVVDQPRIPDRRDGLPRWAVVLIAGAAGLVWVSIVLGWAGWMELRGRSEEEREAYEEVKGLLSSDFEKVRRFLRL